MVYSLFISGLKDWRKKLRLEVEGMEEEREEWKEVDVKNDKLMKEMQERRETIAEIDHQIELEEAKIERVNEESFGCFK